jgi:hypothetical protein
MNTPITKIYKTATVVITMASLLGATPAFAGRATAVSSVDKIPVAASTTGMHAVIPAPSDTNHAARIAKLETDLHTLRSSLNALAERITNKP